MRVREITVRVGTRVSKSYQSAELCVEYTAELGGDENPADVRDELTKEVRDYVSAQIAEVFQATTGGGRK